MNEKNEIYSPIVIFAFNRPEHLKRTIEGLIDNPEFSESTVYVYCDGPRGEEDYSAVQAVRETAHSFNLPNIQIVESEVNQGLGKAIITGVTEVCHKHGRVIVIEDDLQVSRHFLAYMNTALDRYADNEQVMQVVGHCFPAPGYGESNGSSFLPFTSSLGWGTWDRAWQYFDPDLTGYDAMLTDAKERKRFNLDGAYSYTRMISKFRKTGQINRSWGVRWHWSVFKRNGIVLFPHKTLLLHFGDDNTGTNCRGKQAVIDIEFTPENKVTKLPDKVIIDKIFYAAVHKTISRMQSLWSKGIRFVRRWL